MQNSTTELLIHIIHKRSQINSKIRFARIFCLGYSIFRVISQFKKDNLYLHRRYLPLLFVIAIMSLNSIFRKGIRGYQFTKSQEKIYHFVYIYNIKLCCQKKKSEKILETLIQTIWVFSHDTGTEYGIEKCAILIISGKKTNKRNHITTQWRKNKNSWNKRKFQVLGNIWSGCQQTKVNERRNKKNKYFRRTRNLEVKLNHNSSQRN